jgi:hypothetical protein
MSAWQSNDDGFWTAIGVGIFLIIIAFLVAIAMTYWLVP